MPSEQLHIMVIAGEISGDNHGSKLIRELKKQTDVKVTAVGGDRMAEVADRLEENIVSKAAVGFAEVIKFVPYFVNLKKRLVSKYFSSGTEKHIDGLILIDYPGFNVRLAKIASKFNIPVFYYITPQVWAWGKGRIKLLSRICRKLYCLFEFEKELFEKAGGSVEFVGHPILEDIPDNFDVNRFNSEFNLSDNEFLIALLPGSRVIEVKRHLPVIIEAVRDFDCRIVLGKSPSVEEDFVRNIAGDIQMTGDIYTLLKRADIAVVSSGTSTLEAAVIGTPFITVYKVSGLSYAIARLLVSIEFISMVNILAGKEVVPELIQGELKPDNLKNEISRMIDSSEIRNSITEELKIVAQKIGAPGASGRTARSILEELGQ